MISCSNCGAACSRSADFCSSCGHAVSTLGAVPLPSERTVAASEHAAPSLPPLRKGGFAPGTVLAERYRIVALLGRGGMGEVYRAEDIKLGNVIALKFLPASHQKNAAALAALHAEVRNARQVSHPNVCRVYDIGEVNGQHFLAMEYIDGEDLASLLRRIGRLPADKALETAHQMCAGLAAAHDSGFLHRDLKPANIMLDGRGRVRITDFGLALSRDDASGRNEIAGTLAYMAPEQIEKGEASVRSDIYSMGVVFYELFTGRLPFPATNPMELRRAHLESSPRTPSSVVKDMDPVVEGAILRCLQKDPALRPSSVRQVDAAFPGGDPLAAALAAGETPSPEMVAASGGTGSLRPLIAWIMLAGVAAAVAASVLMSARTMLFRRVPLDKPPEALAERARDILKSVGYAEPPVDTAIGFSEWTEFLRYINEHDKLKTRWDNLETGAFVFWYRGSPRPLASSDMFSAAPGFGTIWTNDPPLNVSGMTLVELNPLGRLTQLIAIPLQIDKAEGAASAPDWAPLFSAAGLDPARWTPAQPMWTPPAYGDSRAAWTGSLVERPYIPMRIEAAAYRGKPIYFELIGPWTRPGRMQPYQTTAGEQVGLTLLTALLLSMVVVGGLLARRNLRLGRGDRRGASRLAVFIFMVWTVAAFFGAHHVPNLNELALFFEYLAWGLLLSCFFGVSYIALEPYVRRRWPIALVSWSRLLAGDLRDPLVGRDVIAGCLWGALLTDLSGVLWFVTSWFGDLPPVPTEHGPEWVFLGARATIGSTSNKLIISIVASFAFLFVLVLFRAMLRKQWAAAVAFVLFFTVFLSPTALLAGGRVAAVTFVFGLILNTLTVILIIRLGLLALVASIVFGVCFLGLPLTTQGSAWYSSLSLAGILLMAALALCAFYISLGGRPVFGGLVIEE